MGSVSFELPRIRFSEPRPKRGVILGHLDSGPLALVGVLKTLGNRTPESHREKHSAGHSAHQDRKSTRLNSSHPSISYAVFCLKKKNHHQHYLRLYVLGEAMYPHA